MAAAPQAPQEPPEAPELSKDVSKDVAQPLAQPLAHGFENLEFPFAFFCVTQVCHGAICGISYKTKESLSACEGFVVGLG
jgi:hypothetical protein